MRARALPLTISEPARSISVVRYLKEGEGEKKGKSLHFSLALSPRAAFETLSEYARVSFYLILRLINDKDRMTS